MAPANYFDIFKGANGQWYWNLHDGGNHAIIATGGEGFDSRRNAHDAVKQFQEVAVHAYVPSPVEKASMAQDDILDDVDEDEPDRTQRMSEDAELDENGEVPDTH